MNITRYFDRAALTAGIALAMMGSAPPASALNISDRPLFLTSGAPALNMLTVGRDHKLYTAAYNDASDLNGDGSLDIGYKGYLATASGGIDYYGYFDSFKCYTYSSDLFSPVSATGANKACGGSGQWSGDFLNYVTTSRLDALRKVLYGGHRSTDTSSQTILQRSYVPQDAHSWGKEYQSVSRDGYDIRQYTPFDAPSSGYILFANTTLSNTLSSGTYRNPTGAPLLRVRTDSTHRIWEWVAKNSPVAGASCATGASHTTACTGTLTDYTVRVEVCKASLLEGNCNPKPTGLLHNYDTRMAFGLLTGSYMHNKEGGVIRKELAMFSDELQADGRFTSPKKGIVATLDGIKAQDYDGNGNYNHNHSCTAGWDNENQPDGHCRIWGNPLAEMMYETLRYFTGESSATTGYTYTDSGSDDALLGMPQVTSWKNPYAATSSGGLGYPKCSKPFQTVISDVNPSFDTDLPGTAWGSGPTPPSQISTLNVGTLGQTIWNHEFGTGSKSVYIGQVGATANGAPTPKTASSFGNIRGLSPEEPTKKGSYYSSAVSFFGNTNDINSATGDQKLQTFSVALSSPLPKIEVPVGTGTISMVPFAKVVQGPSGITASWQPTAQIAAFFIESMSNMPGQPADAGVNGGRPYAVFRINFEDAEQGNDFDMDVIARYTVQVTSGNQLSVQLRTEYASAGWESHIGYVISGTDSRDGVYLDVSGGGSQNSTNPLDTPSTVWAGGCMPAGTCTGYTLPGLADGEAASAGGNVGPDRQFSPGAPSATLLKDPLWYAAKYGGFDDKDKDGLPDPGEWDGNNAGTPDNYFLVTNALTLETQLSRAFNEIIDRVSSASSASVNSGSISDESRIYQARFNSRDWTGELLAFQVDPDDGTLIATPEWNAADPSKMPVESARNIFTLSSAGAGMDFTWTAVDADATRKGQLDSDATKAQRKLEYLRGDRSREQSKPGGTFRNRKALLGDIVASAPLFVGAPPFRYLDTLEGAAYSTFRDTKKSRTKMVYVGANDGMLHGFNAENTAPGGDEGKEVFAYVPGAVFKNLSALTSPSYTHRYYVDGSPNMGDVFFGGSWKTVLVGGLNKGGQGIYALNVTDPSSFSASKVLWEFNDIPGTKGDPDLGYTFSRPAIVRLNNNKWAAIFGNGYNNSEDDGATTKSTTGYAALYIVDISDGTLIKKITTEVGSTSNPNGLATPAAVDFDGDVDADYVYAGDLRGNLWKFDLTDASPTNWKVAYTAASKPAPLYIAADSSGNTQPITSRPEVGRGPNGNGMVVLFGTGKFLEDPTDKQLPPTVSRRDQSFYGIYDPNGGSDAFTGRTDLGGQTIVAEPTVTIAGTSYKLRVTSNSAPGSRGWYMDLVSPDGYQGERVVSNPLLRNNRVIFTTLIPDTDPCGFGGSSWLMELDALTGSRLMQSPFDLNRDGKFTDADFAVMPDSSKIPASGMQSSVGITPEPGILTDPLKSIEYKYTPGTSGNIQVVGENPGAGNVGRQSWRQIR